MSIRDENGKLAITGGDWTVGEIWLGTKYDNWVESKGACKHITKGIPERADMDLCAEAGTIANRYDSTPAEMVETIRDLRGLIDFIEEECVMDVIRESCKDALKKTAKYEEAK